MRASLVQTSAGRNRLLTYRRTVGTTARGPARFSQLSLQPDGRIKRFRIENELKAGQTQA